MQRRLFRITTSPSFFSLSFPFLVYFFIPEGNGNKHIYGNGMLYAYIFYFCNTLFPKSFLSWPPHYLLMLNTRAPAFLLSLKVS